jgi:hypothetical protein
MKIRLIVICALLSSGFCLAKRTTKIKYKKRQMIDLGALNIDGEIVSPSDFSIEDEKQKASKMLFKRKKYNDRIQINIDYVL